MPFDPTLPLNNSEIRSLELRNQFTGLKALIDGTTLAQVLAAGSDGGGQPITGVSNLVLGNLGGACIQMYATGVTPTVIAVESQAGNKSVMLRAGENPGDAVGLTAINAPLLLEGAGGVQVRAPLVLLNLPVADPHVVGAVWNDAGTLKVSAG